PGRARRPRPGGRGLDAAPLRLLVALPGGAVRAVDGRGGAIAGLEIRRLHLASLRGPDEREWPVHGFVVMHPKGAILIDTGVGGPERVLTDWRVVNRTAAEALAEHDLVPGDIKFVVNTHLHFDHCGQNAVFKHAPFYVQRVELER